MTEKKREGARERRERELGRGGGGEQREGAQEKDYKSSR